MSASPEPDRPETGVSGGEPAQAASHQEFEQVDALPVLAPVPRVLPSPASASALAKTRLTPAAIPAVQAAAAAAGGFVAGVAVVGLVNRRHRHAASVSRPRRAGRVRPRSARGGATADRAAELLQIVGSRSLLVDVHLLGRGD